MRTAKLKRFLREDGIEELLELARIDALASSGDVRPYEFCRHKLAELEPVQIAPPPLLNGHDLMQLGFEPGSSGARDSFTTTSENAKCET